MLSNQGIIFFKWYYNDPRPHGTKRRLPAFYISCFILGFFDFLYKLFPYLGYLNNLRINFHEWKYTPVPDYVPVDIFYETKSDFFEPYEFTCEVDKLSSNSYKLTLTKYILRQILLEMEY